MGLVGISNGTGWESDKVFVLLKGVEGPELIDGYFGEGFGRPIANKILRVSMPSYSAKTVFSW